MTSVLSRIALFGVIGCAILAALGVGSPRAAHADAAASELQAARELFAKAEKDEEAGRWAAALEKLRRASTVKMTPGLRFHIAHCEEKLGQLVASLADYTAAESAARAEGNKDVLDAVGESLAALRRRVPTLIVMMVTPDAKDAEITLDGAPLATGLWGTAVPLEIGPHLVQAKAAGRTPYSNTVNLVEFDAATVEVRLPAAPRAPASTATPTPTSTSTSTANANATDRKPRTAAIVTTVVAVALAGAGVASYVIAAGKQSDALAQCPTLVSCDDRKGPIRTWDALAIGTWAGGAAVGAIAVYLWLTPPAVTPGTAPGERPATARLVAGPASIRLEGTF